MEQEAGRFCDLRVGDHLDELFNNPDSRSSVKPSCIQASHPEGRWQQHKKGQQRSSIRSKSQLSVSFRREIGGYRLGSFVAGKYGGISQPNDFRLHPSSSSWLQPVT